MSFSSILIATRNLVKFNFTKPLAGDNALLTLKDHNQLVDQLNNNIPYTTRVYTVTQVGTGEPILTQARIISTTNTGSPTPPCKCMCNWPKDSILVGQNGTCQLLCCTNGARIEIGSYTFTVPQAAEFEIGFLFQPLADPTNRLTVERLADVGNDAVFSVKTYATAVLTDGILNRTYFEIKIFTGILQ